MDFSIPIVGHGRQLAQLAVARKSGRVAHAYLFYGPNGIGKEKVAFHFARDLNCSASTEKACGLCESCQRIAKEVHPDVRLLASEEELVERGLAQAEKAQTPSAQIRSHQLAEIGNLFKHRPYLERFKIVIVVDAEKMNNNCQNRFLKTLEEPTEDSLIVLLTSKPDALLKTVRSRCQQLAFGALSQGDIQQKLKDQLEIGDEPASVFAAMAQGSLRRALDLAEGSLLEMREEILTLLDGLQDKNLYDLTTWAQAQATTRENSLDVLDVLELVCRDLLVVESGVEEHRLIFQDRLEKIKQLTAGCSIFRLFAWMDKIRRARSALLGNANPRLMMESVLLEMRKS